jgi:hypothetical protein
MSSFARRALTSAALTVAATGALALTAAPAFAIGPSTVTKSGNILVVTASPGSQNTYRILEDASSFFIRDVTGGGVRPAAGSGCANENGTGQVRCAKTGITQVIVNAGDFDDNIGLGAPAGSQVRFEIRSGAGNDAVAVTAPGTTVRGEGGNDNLANNSFQFPTVLDGGAGTDRCTSRNRADTRISCES